MNGQCLLCKREDYLLRGLCTYLKHACYSKVRILVGKGRTTWDREIAKGRALPRSKPPRIAYRTKGIGGHHRGFRGWSSDWLTPIEIVQALGPFDLDPCSHPEMPWRTAEHMIHPPADGLACNWNGRVWLNPPYGQEAACWLRKLAIHGDGIAIMFARTETAMFFASVWAEATGILFLRGRLHFHRPDGTRARANAGGPSCLVAYGKQNLTALVESRLAGSIVTGWSVR